MFSAFIPGEAVDNDLEHSAAISYNTGFLRLVYSRIRTKSLIREYTGKPVFWDILQNNLIGEYMDQKTRIVAFYLVSNRQV